MSATIPSVPAAAPSCIVCGKCDLFDDFLLETGHMSGSLGFDGWSAHETRLITRLAPWLLRELYGLWSETTCMGSLIPDDL
ncbi:MAG: hypothetical protein ACKPKO_16925, partial [Candidatus Fonsibacter sp.]